MLSCLLWGYANYTHLIMKTIEERAKEYVEKHGGSVANHCFGFGKSYRMAYEAGATEQKAIDEKEIDELFSIMETSASILGIGTKWLNENERLRAVAELKEKIINYLLFSDED